MSDDCESCANLSEENLLLLEDVLALEKQRDRIASLVGARPGEDVADAVARRVAWVPVTERKPSEGVFVLGLFVSGHRSVVSYYAGGRAYWNHSLHDPAAVPTHWMELPPPPSDAGKGGAT